jgi:two-component sensor histidine kinase
VNGEARVRIHGPQVLLEPNAAQSIAVILHELATNAAKYGALSFAKGQIRWTETGGPPVQMPTREGFGGRIINQLAGQLNGRAQFDWHVEGFRCKINVQA